MLILIHIRQTQLIGNAEVITLLKIEYDLFTFGASWDTTSYNKFIRTVSYNI